MAAKITKLQSTVIRGEAVVNERTTNREHATWAGYEQKVRLHMLWPSDWACTEACFAERQ